jgi:hypothetical protein
MRLFTPLPLGRRPGNGGVSSTTLRRAGSVGKLARSNSGTRNGGGRLAVLADEETESTLSRDDLRPRDLPKALPLELGRGGSLGVLASLNVEFAGDGRLGGRVGAASSSGSSSTAS